MIAKSVNKQTTYLVGLFMLFFFSAEAIATNNAWFYHEKLVTPADSRALFKPYQHPEFQLRSSTNQTALKQWSWLKQHKMHHAMRRNYQLKALTNQQGNALPFWPALKPK